jgi:23S rRNA pseudouridine1911/1915/1917 synthase
MAVVEEGRAARTDAWVVARFDLVDLLRLELHTGRTHQVRVHLAHIGHPVLGDPVYGGGGSRRFGGSRRRAALVLEGLTPRQALHAAFLAFQHPATGAPLEFTSEWPLDLRPALAQAAGGDVADSSPLAYLRFFKEHG